MKAYSSWQQLIWIKLLFDLKQVRRSKGLLFTLQFHFERWTLPHLQQHHPDAAGEDQNLLLPIRALIACWPDQRAEPLTMFCGKNGQQSQ